jgi:surfactin synthase thioesterase subunit
VTVQEGSGPWPVRPRTSTPVRRRLFCFPPAGGAASYFREWQHELPADLELCASPPEELGCEGFLHPILSALRADGDMGVNYSFVEEPLTGPIVAFGGTANLEALPDDLARWREHTSTRSGRYRFPGDHFFVRTARPMALATIVAKLTALGSSS